MKEKREHRNQNSIRKIFLLVFIVMTVTSINACGYLGIFGEASWKEEVLLHDGSKIIVKRWQKRSGGHEIGQKPDVSEQSIKFTLPGTNKTITWKDEYSKEIDRSNFTLVALHIINATPYIITTPRLCLSYNKWGRPNPPYVIFKYEGNAWKRIDITELPAEFKNINLVINTLYHDQKLVSQGMASAEMVTKMNRSLTQPEYKTIIRTPLESVGCGEEFYDGTYWRGMSKLKRQPSYEKCVAVCNEERISVNYCPCKKLFKTNTEEK